jgi:hypothetical protein
MLDMAFPIGVKGLSPEEQLVCVYAFTTNDRHRNGKSFHSNPRVVAQEDSAIAWAMISHNTTHPI